MPTVDASSPARVTSTTALSVTTAAFDPPDNSVVIVCIGADGGAADFITLSNNGVAVTWTQIIYVGPNSVSGGHSQAFYGVVPTARTGMTITAARSLSDDMAIKVYVVTGANTSDPIGAVTGGSSITSPITTPAITTRGSSSLGFVLGNDYNHNAGQSSTDTTFDNYNAANQITGGSGYKTLGSSGSSETFNLTWTPTTGLQVNYGAFEVIDAAAPSAVTPGTVTHVATSTPTAVGTTTSASTVSITPTLPTGTASGDRIYVIQAGNNTSGTTPASWTALAKDVQVGPTATAPGAGTGRRYLSIYYRDYDGVWTMPAFTLTSATQNTHALSAITLRKGATDTWDTPLVSTAGNTAAAVTAYSVTTGALLTGAGDIFVVGMATNDNVTASAESLRCGAVTFANLAERSDTGLATGNDVSIKSYTADFVAGGVGTVTHAATLSAASEGGSLAVAQSSTAAIVVPAFWPRRRGPNYRR